MSMRQNLGFAEGMLIGMARSEGIEKGRVLDWDKAAQIIKEKKPQCVEAGLAEDWGCTSREIYVDGKISEDSACYYGGSKWATPIIVADGEEIECWLNEDETEFQCQTWWPESARRILHS